MRHFTPSLKYHLYSDSRVGSGGGPSTPETSPGPTPAPTPPPIGMTRTVVFLQQQTAPGQDVFVRGGISHDQRPGKNKKLEMVTSQSAKRFYPARGIL